MIKFPFTSLQQFNLDWIMQQLHKILDFMPLNGVAGDVLQRTVDGAAWQPIAAISMDIHSLNVSSPDGADEIPIYDNDLAGNYKVTVQDVLDLVPPAPVDSVNGKIGAVVLDKDDIGLDNVDNVQQYSASNPPPYPVTSVNGQTGAVTVIGGVSSVNGQTGAVTLTIPTDTSDLTNSAGFVDAAGAAAVAPVQSVNGLTGEVVISTGSSPTLLWTNYNILSSFASQTVSIDLTGYSFVIIEFAIKDVTMISYIYHVPTLPPPVGYSSYDTAFGLYMNGSNGLIANRSLKISTSGIDFTVATRFDNYNNSNTSDNTKMIPSRIWGIA